MPIYDFNCTNADCANPEFEALVKMGTTLTTCPDCNSKARKADVTKLRHSEKQPYANASSVRFHFNWQPF